MANNSISILVLLVTLTAFPQTWGQTRSVKFQNCGPEGSVTAVKITPCSSDPCVLKRGTVVQGEVDFTAVSNSSTAVLSSTIRVFGVPIKVPMDQPNACVSILECPIVAKKSYTYIGTAHILPNNPPLFWPVTMEDKMAGDNGSVIYCIKFKLITK